MVQGRGGTRFAAEALQSFRISDQVVRQEFESDESTKLRVFGLVDHTHPAATNFLDNAVVRDGLANHSKEC